MQEIFNYKIKIDSELLETIKGSTISYKNKKDIKFGCLFSDLNKVLALEFNSKGVVISRSNLLLDEEEDVLDETTLLDEEKIGSELLEKYKIEYFLTRDESFKNKYLLKELNYLAKEKDYEKLNYLYEEIFPQDKLTFSEKIAKLIKEINENYNNKLSELYEIVRLTYIKK